MAGGISRELGGGAGNVGTTSGGAGKSCSSGPDAGARARAKVRAGAGVIAAANLLITSYLIPR